MIQLLKLIEALSETKGICIIDPSDREVQMFEDEFMELFPGGYMVERRSSQEYPYRKFVTINGWKISALAKEA